jgi:hypothetical protein
MDGNYVVFERNMRPDGTGGNRTIHHYESEQKFQEENLSQLGNCTLLAKDINIATALKICCRVPDLCLAISLVEEMFDPETGIIKSLAEIKPVVNSAAYGLSEIHSLQKRFGFSPYEEDLPDVLKYLGPAHEAKTDKEFFIRSLRDKYPTGVIDDLSRFSLEAIGIVRQIVEHHEALTE